MQDDHDGTRNGIAEGEGGNGPKDDHEFRVWENAVVEEENREFDGDYSRMIEDCGRDFRFRG